MKIYIAYKFKSGPYGGANQFLKALKQELVKQDSITEDLQTADAVLANANPSNLLQLIDTLIQYRQANPKGKIIIRVDGPIYLIRGQDQYIDQAIHKTMELLADSIIYQSNWSLKQNQQGNKIKFTQTVIVNAVDSTIFFPSQAKSQSQKKRLIATSWSPNPRKGFEIYKHLDENLDWSKYSMTFVGNSPIKFKNIKKINPLNSQQLAEQLRVHDLYITASQNDPCSNSLLEALACGLPVIARNSGGHPELIQSGGVLFDCVTSAVNAITEATRNYSTLKQRIPNYEIQSVANQYIDFINSTPSPKNPLTAATYSRAQLLKIGYAVRLATKQAHNYYEQIRQR